MAILNIVRMGNPVLRKKARKLAPAEIRSAKIRQLVDSMIETMHYAKGIGLAAPQVNQSLQLAVIEFDSDNPRYHHLLKSLAQPLLILFNPKIKVLDEKKSGYWEGCLSVPGLRGFVRRPRKIQVDYLDSDAQKRSLVVKGFLSTVFQHELDHLQGSLYLDHILPQDRNRLAYEDEYIKYWVK